MSSAESYLKAGKMAGRDPGIVSRPQIPLSASKHDLLHMFGIVDLEHQRLWNSSSPFNPPFFSVRTEFTVALSTVSLSETEWLSARTSSSSPNNKAGNTALNVWLACL